MTRRPRRGASALEFALVLPVFIAIVFGLVDWSWYMFQWMSVDMAVNHGVRLAAGEKDDPTGVALASVESTLTRYGVTWDASQLSATQVTSGGETTIQFTATIPFDAPTGLVPTPDNLECTASVAWYGDAVSP